MLLQYPHFSPLDESQNWVLRLRIGVHFTDVLVIHKSHSFFRQRIESDSLRWFFEFPVGVSDFVADMIHDLKVTFIPTVDLSRVDSREVSAEMPVCT